MRTLEHLREYYWSGTGGDDVLPPIRRDESLHEGSMHMSINAALELRNDLCEL
jgi:hypothetical protein